MRRTQKIRQLEKRANVLPVVSHTDSLTIDELEDVKAAVNRDLAAVFARTPGKGFGVFRTGHDESRQVRSFEICTQGERTRADI